MRASLVMIFLAIPSSALVAQEPSKPAATKAEGKSIDDPKAFMQAVIKAMGDAKLVSYDVDYAVTGWFSFFLPNIKGSVVMGKETPNKTQRFRSTLVVEPSGSAEKSTVTAGADGEIYYVIDEASKTVYADIDPAVVGKFRWGIEFAMVKEFAAPDPFAEVLKDGEIKFEGSSKVEDVDCVSIRLKSASNPEALWDFAVSDKLPRRVTYAQENEKGEKATAVMTLRKLTVNPKFDKDPFQLAVPEGYKRTDEFAP